jgi:hypothetical protein
MRDIDTTLAVDVICRWIEADVAASGRRATR